MQQNIPVHTIVHRITRCNAMYEPAKPLTVGGTRLPGEQWRVKRFSDTHQGSLSRQLKTMHQTLSEHGEQLSTVLQIIKAKMCRQQSSKDTYYCKISTNMILCYKHCIKTPT